MAQFVELDRGDTAIEPFFDVLQEMLSGAAPSLALVVHDATTVKVVGGAGHDQQTASIEGRYRWRTDERQRAHPGGVAGTYDIYLTASDNDITAGGSSAATVDSTDYSFDLEIKASGSTPSADLWRKVGEVDWSGTGIIGLRQLAGSRRDDAPLMPKAPIPALTPLRVRGAAGQTAWLATFEDSAGTLHLGIEPEGGLIWNGPLRHYGDAVGFFGVTPQMPRASATTDIKDALASYGLLRQGDASPLNLDGGALTAGAGALTALSVTGNVRLGDADSDTVGFFSVTGAARAGATADIKDALTAYGLLVGTSASPLNLDGGQLTAGGLTTTGNVRLGDADSDTVGFFSASGVVRDMGWGTPLATEGALRTALTNTSTLDDLRRYVKTLASVLKTYGLLGA